MHVSSNAVTVHVRDSESTAPFPPPADPTVSVADAEANEIDGKMTFVITMSRAKGSEGTKVGYTTSDGTAKAGEDYEKTSGYVTIRPGDTEATVDVALIDDAVPDDGETLGFGLNFLSAATFGDAWATGTISNTETMVSATNTPATGAPTIARTPQVGETLSASMSGIADADGLDEATFAYQWIRGNADIAGATGSSCTLAEARADQGTGPLQGRRRERGERDQRGDRGGRGGAGGGRGGAHGALQRRAVRT